MYPPERLALPEPSAADRAREPAAAFRNARKEQDSMSDAQRREAIQAYLASISFMDAQVGSSCRRSTDCSWRIARWSSSPATTAITSASTVSGRR